MECVIKWFNDFMNNSTIQKKINVEINVAVFFQYFYISAMGDVF